MSFFEFLFPTSIKILSSFCLLLVIVFLVTYGVASLFSSQPIFPLFPYLKKPLQMISYLFLYLFFIFPSRLFNWITLSAFYTGTDGGYIGFFNLIEISFALFFDFCLSYIFCSLVIYFAIK